VAKAKGRPRGKQPKLNVRQEARLSPCTEPGDHSVAELGDLFGVARSTVYRAIQRDAARQPTSRQLVRRREGWSRTDPVAAPTPPLELYNARGEVLSGPAATATLESSAAESNRQRRLIRPGS
jgi:hypothetical protein